MKSSILRDVLVVGPPADSTAPAGVGQVAGRQRAATPAAPGCRAGRRRSPRPSRGSSCQSRSSPVPARPPSRPGRARCPRLGRIIPWSSTSVRLSRAPRARAARTTSRAGSSSTRSALGATAAVEVDLEQRQMPHQLEQVGRPRARRAAGRAPRYGAPRHGTAPPAGAAGVPLPWRHRATRSRGSSRVAWPRSPRVAEPGPFSRRGHPTICSTVHRAEQEADAAADPPDRGQPHPGEQRPAEHGGERRHRREREERAEEDRHGFLELQHHRGGQQLRQVAPLGEEQHPERHRRPP